MPGRKLILYCQLGISTFVLLFCFYKLIVLPDDSPNVAIFWSGITSILGLWSPSPMGQQNKTQQIGSAEQVIQEGDNDGQQ